MTHNDLKKGMSVKGPGLFGVGPREMTIQDNKKGAIRFIECLDTNGHYPEMGSTYVWEITHAKVDGEWQKITLSPAHAKVRDASRSLGF